MVLWILTEFDLAAQRFTTSVSGAVHGEQYRAFFFFFFLVQNCFRCKQETFFWLPLPTVEAFEEVSDSLCVPQYNSDGEERVILFLKMALGKVFSQDLVAKIKGAIRKALSARHVPALVLETGDIPVRKSWHQSDHPWMKMSPLTWTTLLPPAVHHQRQEGRSGSQTGDCWPGGDAEGGFFQPRLSGPLQEHSWTAELLGTLKRIWVILLAAVHKYEEQTCPGQIHGYHRLYDQITVASVLQWSQKAEFKPKLRSELAWSTLLWLCRVL